jgi:hypothetical protein
VAPQYLLPAPLPLRLLLALPFSVPVPVRLVLPTQRDPPFPASQAVVDRLLSHASSSPHRPQISARSCWPAS